MSLDSLKMLVSSETCLVFLTDSPIECLPDTMNKLLESEAVWRNLVIIVTCVYTRFQSGMAVR